MLLVWRHKQKLAAGIAKNVWLRIFTDEFLKYMPPAKVCGVDSGKMPPT
jgi:hypothetical protein